jgi:putative DNA methylase
VKSPNPAFAHLDVPLVSSFVLSTRPGKEAYVEPRIETDGYRFTVRTGKPKDATATEMGTKLARANFFCLMSKAPISGDYIKAEGIAGRMGARLMAIVAECQGGRIYLEPTAEHEMAARTSAPQWKPEVTISGSTQYLGVKPYGMDRFDQLFTPRQLATLATFSDLVPESRELAKRDALAAGLPDDGDLNGGGAGAVAYADALAVYLSFSVDKMTDTNTSLCSWQIDPPRLRATFGRQALPMVWDFAEAGPFADAAGDFGRCVQSLSEVLERQLVAGHGYARQEDATTLTTAAPRVFSTDPPYYDNVPYADLADFFYVWLRRSMKAVYPDLFATLATPKAQELVAFAYRHHGKAGAEAFFLDGMKQAMHRLAEQSHPAFPVTIYYAFKQSENEDGLGTSSTGWDTFLEAAIKAGFVVSGTWPIRSELATRNRGRKSNALASSIVLVCRPRAGEAPSATRREFAAALKAELPAAVADLQRGNIAPVDLAQAAIGPGMAVYTRYAKVLDAEGKLVSVRDALSLINQTLDEALAEQEGDFDADSRWALAWFEQSGFAEGDFGVAETLSKAKNTSVHGLDEAGILTSGHGKVRLLKPAELPADWDPLADKRLTDWEIVHHLIRVLEDKEAGSESAAAELVSKLGSRAETARELCYRLYTLCERKKRAADALSYNALVQSWPEIVRLAREGAQRAEQGGQLQFGDLE